MFIFEFKNSKEHLLRAIVITGKDITIYTSKCNSLEFASVRSNSVLLPSITLAEDSFHHFLHHPTVEFSAAQSAFPHQHLQFHDASDKLKQLEDFFEFLHKRQSTPLLRANDCVNVIKSLEQEKKSLGHDKLPRNIQEMLEDFDTITPFFSQGEKERCLRLFRSYIKNPYYLKIEMLREFAENLMHDNGQTLCNRKPFHEPDEAERPLINFCDTLILLREIFLAIDKKPFRTGLYLAADDNMKILMNNPNMPTEGRLIDTINYFKNFVAKRFAVINMVWMYIISAAVFMISRTILPYTREISIVKVALLSLLTSASSTLGAYYLSIPSSTYYSNRIFIRTDSRQQATKDVKSDEQAVDTPDTQTGQSYQHF